MQLKTCKMSHKKDLELRCVRSSQWECECIYIHKVYIDEVDMPTRKPPANEQAINMFSSKNTRTCKFTKKQRIQHFADNTKIRSTLWPPKQHARFNLL